MGHECERPGGLYGSTQTGLSTDASLVQIGASVNTFAPGLFNGGARNIGDMASTVTLQVRAWTGGAATYELAEASAMADPNVDFGRTHHWVQTVGGGTIPTPPITGPGRFQGLDLTIPEPSSLALAVLGVGAFFFFRGRREK